MSTARVSIQGGVYPHLTVLGRGRPPGETDHVIWGALGSCHLDSEINPGAINQSVNGAPARSPDTKLPGLATLWACGPTWAGRSRVPSPGQRTSSVSGHARPCATRLFLWLIPRVSSPVINPNCDYQSFQGVCESFPRRTETESNLGSLNLAVDVPSVDGLSQLSPNFCSPHALWTHGQVSGPGQGGPEMPPAQLAPSSAPPGLMPPGPCNWPASRQPRVAAHGRQRTHWSK